MNRDHPPCNTCSKHDCRSCAWTSPLDASYQRLLRSTSLITILALNPRDDTPMPSEPSWLGLATKRVLRFFTDRSARSR
jgi:hypothetical protein